MTQPWERLPDEPNHWFQRFEAFRQMGPGRDLTTAYNQERVGRSLPRSTQASGAWRNRAETFRWHERASAWDQWLTDQKEAAIEARWKAEIMGPTEILGRLSRMGRARPHDFFGWSTSGLMMGFDLQMLEAHGDLVKKMGSKVTANGPEFMIELYDGQSAIVKMGQHEKLFTDQLALSNPDGSPLQGDNGRYDRAISTLADALRDILPGASAEQDINLDAPK